MASAIVLLNFGGPRDLGEVSEFLFEILRDPNTIQLPLPQTLQDLLARRIARRRTPEIERQYGEIGGRSPIVADTDAIAAALRAYLADAGQELPLFVAHRYLPGHCAATAREIVATLGAVDGGAPVNRLFAIPLYPQFSFATTGSALQQLDDELRGAGFQGEVRALRSYAEAPGYLDALAARLEEALAASGAAPEETVVLCSAHGLPRSYVERGDPYRLELYRTFEALQERFPLWRFELSFQSRVGPAEWLRPYTDEYVPVLAERGARHLVFVPLAFVNDHIETLYEIGVTYFELARRCGMTPHRAEAVGAHPAHVRTLAEAALRWAAGRGGVPIAELLPPDQSFRRKGLWAWSALAVALVLTLYYALCR